MTPDPRPQPVRRQTPASAAWLDRYRELVVARGSAAALTRKDLAELARGMREIPEQEVRRG